MSQNTSYGSEGEFIKHPEGGTWKKMEPHTVEFEKLCRARHDVICTKFEATELALELRTKELDRRMEELNHWKRESGQFLTKDMYNARHEAVVNRLTKLESSFYIWGGVITAISLLLQLVFHFYNPTAK
jgi:hypothetical protein